MRTAGVVRLAGTEYRVRLERSGGEVAAAVVDGPRGSRRFRVQQLADGLLLLDGAPVEARVTGGAAGAAQALHAEGESWPVEVLSTLEAALRRGAPASGGPVGRTAVRSPMPGRVLAVEAEEGAAVTAGAPLFILEAMKMENEIRAPHAGVVRHVRVAPGDAVEGDQELCELVHPAASGGSAA